MKVIQKKEINLVNFYDYALAARRTLNIFKEQRFDTGHYGYGVLTEFFELDHALEVNDRVNISEECGDAFWYMANHALDIFKEEDSFWKEISEIFYLPQYSISLPSEEFKFYKKYLSEYGDICKKHFVYGKKIEGYDYKIKDLILKMCKSLVSIILNLKLNPVQCLNNNISKLYDRYPDKFDSYFAMNRDLIKEYKTLSNI